MVQGAKLFFIIISANKIFDKYLFFRLSFVCFFVCMFFQTIFTFLKTCLDKNIMIFESVLWLFMNSCPNMLNISSLYDARELLRLFVLITTSMLYIRWRSGKYGWEGCVSINIYRCIKAIYCDCCMDVYKGNKEIKVVISRQNKVALKSYVRISKKKKKGHTCTLLMQLPSLTSSVSSNGKRRIKLSIFHSMLTYL